MNSSEIAALVPAVVGLVTALAAWLRAQSAHRKINAHKDTPHVH